MATVTAIYRPFLAVVHNTAIGNLWVVRLYISLPASHVQKILPKCTHTVRLIERLQYSVFHAMELLLMLLTCVFQATRRRDRVTGLNSVHYQVESKTRLTVDGAPVRMINVHLKCNYQDTPWCITPTDYKVIQGAQKRGMLVPKEIG